MKGFEHKIHTGPNDGKFQHTRAGDRYLLDGKKVKVGPNDGHFQTYGKNKKRYLLK
jgi:hypothetical protein